MADISSITLPGGGTYDLKDKNAVPKYGMGKNLLRNWYFVNPVNQRGLSSYSGVAYGVDGWLGGGSASIVDIQSNGLSIDGTFVYQYLDNASVYLGQTIILSAIVDGTLVVSEPVAVSNSWGTRTLLNDGYFVIRMLSEGKIQFRIYPGDSARVYAAVKLELGTEQTLAHQENGVWILNEIPDYEYELYRCMTSTADPSDTYANKSLATRQDLTSIQATGTTNTTGAVIPAGTCFYLNGVLHIANTQIDISAPFTPGTNCEPTTFGNELAGRLYVIFNSASLLDIHSGGTIPIADNTPSLDKYKFIVLRLTTNSSDNSSTRGVVMAPLVAIRTGPYIPAVVGGVSGWLRISASSDYKSFLIISTSFTNLFLATIYGVI